MDRGRMEQFESRQSMAIRPATLISIIQDKHRLVELLVGEPLMIDTDDCKAHLSKHTTKLNPEGYCFGCQYNSRCQRQETAEKALDKYFKEVLKERKENASR